MNEAEKYDLTKEEFEKSLKLAEMAILMRGERQENPKSIFIISQAGGGKTGLKSYLKSQTRENFIEINPDEVAIFHKYYHEILKEFPNESHTILQKFVFVALDKFLRQRAVQLRNNLIQEGTFGGTNGYLEILEFQKNGGKAPIGKMKEDGQREEVEVKGGYNVQINILAVDRFESLLSSYEREQYFIESNLPPRAVTAENHDRAYYNLLKTVEIVEKRKLFDEMRVFKRGYSENQPELVHIAGDGRYPNVVECIKEARSRDRKRLLDNPKKYLKRIETLKSKVETQIQLDKIEKLENEFNLCLEQYKENQLEQD